MRKEQELSIHISFTFYNTLEMYLGAWQTAAIEFSRKTVNSF